MCASLRFLVHACAMVKKHAPCDILSCFRNWYFMPFKRMFRDSNVHKMFSALNSAIIYIKPFISKNTTFSSVSILNIEWSIISPLNKHFVLNTSSLTSFKTSKNTDWLTQQAFRRDIPSERHPSPTTLCVIIIFMLLVSS